LTSHIERTFGSATLNILHGFFFPELPAELHRVLPKLLRTNEVQLGQREKQHVKKNNQLTSTCPQPQQQLRRFEHKLRQENSLEN